MSYVGSSAAVIPVGFSGVNSQSFNGDGSTVAFTLNRPVSAVNAIEVMVNNVQQSPYDGSYSVSSTTLTFSAAPSSGTANIYVVYRDFPVGSITDTNAVQKTGDTMTGNLIVDGNVGIGTSSPGARLHVTSAVSGSYGAIIYNTHATGQGLTVRAGSTSSQDAFNVQTYDGGTSLLAVQAGGNVGIGTSSPNKPLTVATPQTANTVMEVLRLTGSGTYNSGGSNEAGAGVSFGQYSGSYPNWNLGQISGVRSGASWDGALTFSTNSGSTETSITERMRIDSAGRVTMPYQPSFYVGRSGSAYFTNTVIIFNYFSDPGKHNTGSHYNTSTGLFTAPVAGRYMFHTRVIYEGVGNGAAMTDAFHWNINGSTTGYSDKRSYYSNSITGDGGYYTDTATILVALNAGDTVGVYNTRNWLIHGNATYSTFSGFLIG